MRIEEFQDYLEKDLAWRKQEISQLYMILNTAESKEIVKKSMILLLYAHWEGYIKNSSKCYLKYVSDKNIKLQNLTRNFEAIMLKNYARECIDQDSLNLAKEFAFLNKQEKSDTKPFRIKVNLENELEKDYIDTQHNLSSKVLKSIVQIIGVEYNDAIKTRDQYVDVNLLKKRNAIGHGSQLTDEESSESCVMGFEQIIRLKDFVVVMLDYFAEVLLKYVEEEYYLKTKNGERILFEKEQEKRLGLQFSKIETEKYFVGERKDA